MKKFKGHFSGPSHPSHPSHPSNPSDPSHQIKHFEEKARPKSNYLGDRFFFQSSLPNKTRPVGLVVMCEHWTLKGDCKERGNKERKVHQKIEIAFKFKWKILHELIGPRKKIISEFPLLLIWPPCGTAHLSFYHRFCFTRKSFVKFCLFNFKREFPYKLIGDLQ